MPPAADYPEVIMPDGLTPLEHRVARLLALGSTPKAVGAQLKLSPTQVLTIVRKRDVRQRIGTLVHDLGQHVQEELAEAEVEAAHTLRQALQANIVAKDGSEQPDWDARIKAADSLLDRMGVRGQSTQHVESKMLTAHLSGPELTKAIASALTDPGIPKELKIEAIKELEAGEPQD